MFCRMKAQFANMRISISADQRIEKVVDMDKPMTFGRYIREKRLARDMTMREICSSMALSLPYMSDIENDRRHPMDKERLAKLMHILNLDEKEQQELYDLAGRARETISPDLTDYIMDTEEVRIALRTARDAGIAPSEWLRFTREINRDSK